MQPIIDIARAIGLAEEDLYLFGPFKAKVDLQVLDRIGQHPPGRYVAVTSITPTPLGEGKTVTTIGLAEALYQSGHRAIACIRQPSMGPTFGVKGGGAGGGRARVVPTEDMNLHLTGDTHAVGAAQNLLAAAVDSHLFHGNALGIDPGWITVKRVLDLNDRALRHIVIGLGERHSIPRETGFDLTPGSEVMGILALATSLDDLRERLQRMVVGFTRAGAPVTAAGLEVSGAMAALLRDALMPNLLQTLSGSPVFVHTGSFGNIGIGNSSVIADLLASRLGDFVVTECGFGAELGLEKLVHLKSPLSGLLPDCVVLVATIRALKVHGGAGRAIPGRPLPEAVLQENLPALDRGCENLAKQIANARRYGAPVIVAINLFSGDRPVEIAHVRARALGAGAVEVCASTVYDEGPAGGAGLAEAVIAACEVRKDVAPPALTAERPPIKEQVETIARELYGADGVDYHSDAERGIRHLTDLGYGSLPVCMAKTPLSLSHDPKLLGVPTGFRLPVRDVRPWIGAGLVHVLCGEIQTMPGLPSSPAFRNIAIVGREIVGLE